MQLQQSQLDTLSEWLSKMEERIAQDEPAASDINRLRKQVDTHKVRDWLLLGQNVEQGASLVVIRSECRTRCVIGCY